MAVCDIVVGWGREGRICHHDHDHGHELRTHETKSSDLVTPGRLIGGVEREKKVVAQFAIAIAIAHNVLL